MRMVRAFWAMS
jgi:hypothetical protein